MIETSELIDQTANEAIDASTALVRASAVATAGACIKLLEDDAAAALAAGDASYGNAVMGAAALLRRHFNNL